MGIKAIASAIGNKAARPTLIVRKHSPTILFGVGVLGVVATVVLASRATLKLDELLEKTEKKIHEAKTLESKDYSDHDRQRDLAVIYTQTALGIVKLYGPAVIVGLASIGALSGSQIILNRRNAGLIAAYGVLDKGFRAYRERVVDEFGKEKDQEFRHDIRTLEIVEETEEGPVVKTIKSVGPNSASVYARIFDETSSSWSPQWGANQLFIQCQQNYANDLLKSRGHIFLNEVYDMLRLPRSKEGALVGWVYGKGGDDFVDFGVFEGDVFSAMRFVNGHERSVLLDFNVDGVIIEFI